VLKAGRMGEFHERLVRPPLMAPLFGAVVAFTAPILASFAALAIAAEGFDWQLAPAGAAAEAGDWKGEVTHCAEDVVFGLLRGLCNSCAREIDFNCFGTSHSSGISLM
jgi:hypothetical protein